MHDSVVTLVQAWLAEWSLPRPVQNLSHACLQSGFKEIALPTAAQTVRQAEMNASSVEIARALILGEDISHSLSLQCFHLNLSILLDAI